MHILYSLALGLALAISSPWWIWRLLRAGKYRAGVWERLGRVPDRLRGGEGAVWVHAVSVGEVLAMSAMLPQLREAWPGRRIVVSTTTATGQRLARERFGEANVFFFSMDFAFAVKPFVRTLKPALVVMAEAEFWPNFLRIVKANGARVAVVNARVSDRSFPRYKRFRFVFARVLRHVDRFLAQTEQDATRLVAMGADAERVSVAGNLKFDVKAPAQVPVVAELKSSLASSGAGAVIVAGSTLAGEEEMLVRAFRAVAVAQPRAVMLLAPRHPERFGPVAELLAASGLPWWRRTAWKPETALNGGILLLDSIGELAAIYQLATVAFVGGSLVPAGGHNIVEPAQFGVPVMVGPHTENFREMVEIFSQAGALRIVVAENLEAELLALLANDAQRNGLGRRAAETVTKYSGATSRTVTALLELLPAEAACNAERKKADPVVRA